MQPGFAPHDNQAEKQRLAELFARQRSAYAADVYPSAAVRRDRLGRLRLALEKHQDALCRAISEDFGHRSLHESKLLEFFPSYAGIDHSRRHVGKWMKPEKRGVSIWFLPASNSVVPQPLGVVGIIVPWNYPLLLAVGPLTSALTAGNRAIIKMSEYTPRTGETLRLALAEFFSEDEVAVINGGVEVAQTFATYAWDHLLFTGSTSVGRQVMRAAADNLTPVTLELGGKSPVVVHRDYPIATAAERILHGKCLNAGQTCVAPDYVLLPRGQEETFIEAARQAVRQWYPDLAASPDYSAVINRRHLERLQGYLDDALSHGARVVPLGECDPASGKLAPTLVFNVSEAMRLMQDEIFGPILPILSVDSVDEAISYINARPRPLALYYFDHDNERIGSVLTRTHSGGAAINETVIHVGQDDLPFGGVGPSGMGHYHGRDGFDTMSKRKGVFAQSRLNGLPLMRPPYGPRIEALLKFMLR
ncbi:coniferyl aldehyde dehydrogenase [Chitinimonas lacunae]|uniref:Aldehyde dehydrogenase n=1 Tax=Chitinimonas lacunae TaxID=1963018 RepID=A0ABV8MLP8_9NEIS